MPADIQPDVINTGNLIEFGPSENTLDLIKQKTDEYQQAISELIDAAKFLSTTMDEFSAKNSLLNLAFIYAKANIEASAKGIVLSYIDDACTFSQEFDYPLYRERLFSAVEVNWEKNEQEKIFNLSWESEKSTVSVSLDFTKLGPIEEWAQAIIKTREDLAENIGDKKRTPKQKEAQKEKEPLEQKVQFWSEKYYGSATGTYQGKNAAEYADKYRKTIIKRLDQISKDHAPFWYILENGNSEIAGLPSPEPKIRGTHFIDKAGKTIQELAKKLFDDGYKKAEEEFKKLIQKDWGVIIGDLPDAEENVVKKIENIVVRLSSDDLKKEVEDIKTRKAFYKKMVDVDVEAKFFVSSRGRPFARVWVIDESGKKKELRRGTA